MVRERQPVPEQMPADLVAFDPAAGLTFREWRRAKIRWLDTHGRRDEASAMYFGWRGEEADQERKAKP